MNYNISLKNLSQQETESLLPDNLILLGYRGSIAHNMYVHKSNPNSIDDKDIMGIYIAPIDHYLGIKQIKEVKEKFIKEWDCVCYELRKIINLLIKGNPNVLSLLWVKEQHIIFNTKWGELLRENRNLFTSKQVYHSFNGYAWGQFKRMTHQKYNGYMGAKRKALVDKYKFDTKNAAHLVRLLKMGIEFLKEGVLYVEREDAPYLLSIKNGEWPLEKVKAEAERLFKLCEETYTQSKLPNTVNHDKINDLCKQILIDYHKENLI